MHPFPPGSDGICWVRLGEIHARWAVGAPARDVCQHWVVDATEASLEVGGTLDAVLVVLLWSVEDSDRTGGCLTIVRPSRANGADSGISTPFGAGLFVCVGCTLGP